MSNDTVDVAAVPVSAPSSLKTEWSRVTFTGLTPVLTAFASITGILGTFVSAAGTKYLEIYPRTTADIVTQ